MENLHESNVVSALFLRQYKRTLNHTKQGNRGVGVLFNYIKHFKAKFYSYEGVIIQVETTAKLGQILLFPLG